MNGFSRPRPVPFRSIPFGRAASALILAAAAVGAGCVGYSSWPPEEGSKVPSNPNFNEMRLAMTTALQWTVDRYPPGPVGQPVLDTPVAINLPEGVRSSMYRIIVENVADNAQPLTPENTHLPIYHITAVSVIGDDATVNIARPVSGWGTDHPVYQGVTLELRGGMFREWRVAAHRLWTVGAMQPPAYSFIPDSVRESESQEAAAPEAAPDDAMTPAPTPSEEVETPAAAPGPAPSGEAPGEAPDEAPAEAPPVAPGGAGEPNAGAPTWD